MDLLKAIEGFLYSRLADGYAPVTLRGYQSSLETLAEYLGNPEIESITPTQLKQFMHYLHTDYRPQRRSGSLAPLASASYHRYWKAIRCFFKWASAELQASRPDLDLKMPTYTNRVITPLNDQEISKLIKACDYRAPASGGSRKPFQCKRPPELALRDKTIIRVLLDTGLRSGELSRLKIKDVNLENGEVHVLPYHVRKTRPRTVFLGKSSKKSLWKYLAIRKDYHPDDPLFVTFEGKMMDQARIRATLNQIAHVAGVSNVHPHRFRHTFAIQFLRNGGDVFSLRRLLGHATLEMVRHYLDLANTDSAEAHRKASPVDRWSV